MALAPGYWVGSSTSGTASHYGLGENGRLLRRLGVWAGPRFLWGIRVWLSDHSASQLFGSAQGVYAEYTFDDGERITQLSLWGDGFGNHSGGIQFSTSKGNLFRHTMTDARLQTEWPADVASGICVGVLLRSGAGGPIYILGLRFLNPISGSVMSNVRYPNLDSQAAAIRPLTLRQFRDENHSTTEPVVWGSSGSYTTVTSSSWSVTAGIAIHASVTVSAGIPTIAEVQGTSGWEVSTSTTHATSTEKSETTEWTRSGTLPPRQWLNFEVTTRRGVISLPYEATMTVSFVNSNALLVYNVVGNYAGVAYTRIDIITTMGSLDNSTFHAQIKDVLCSPLTIYHIPTGASTKLQATFNGTHGTIAHNHAAEALPLLKEPPAQVLEPSPEKEQINRNEDKHPPMTSATHDAGVGQATINELYILD